MHKISRFLDSQKKWRLRSIKKSDLHKLTYGDLYSRYINLMKMSYLDHLLGKKVYLVMEVKPPFAKASSFAKASEDKSGDKKIAGQIIIDWRILKDESKSDGKTRAYLYSLRVFPPFQSRGLGTAMIKFCEEFLQKKNFKYATIACEKKNPRALKLYERLGFKIFKEENVPWEFVDDKGVSRKVEELEWVLVKELTN